MVKEVLSSKRPSGWHTQNNIVKIQESLSRKNWKLEWNARISNFLADGLAKMTFVSNYNLLFFDFDLATLLEKLKDTLFADLVGIQHLL